MDKPTPLPKKILAQGQYMQLVREGHWEYVHRTCGIGATVIVAITPAQEILFVEQYRIPLGKIVVDLPAGLVGDDQGCEQEDFASAARRELLEETGYQAKSLKLLAAGPTSSGMATEQVHFFLARNVKKVAAGGGLEGEGITVHVVPLKNLSAWLRRQERQGKLVDVKAFFAASWAALKFA